MLIAISGSQGCGKTTLINELVKTTGCNVINRKTSRSILSDWNVSLSEVNNNHELTVRFQNEILARKIEDEMNAVADKNNVYVTERTYVDLFVYALVALGKDNKYSEWIDQYYIACMAAQQSYDAIFYLTAGHFSPENDGVRGINKHYSKMVDNVMFMYTYTEPDNKVHVIATPHLDKRVENISTWMSMHT